MRIEQKIRYDAAIALENDLCDLESTQFVPVAIPENADRSRSLKVDLEAYDIPVVLEDEITQADLDQTDIMPVLVPESRFEQASEIVGFIELNAIDDDDFDDDDDDDDDDGLDDLDDDDEDDDWDEDEDEDLELDDLDDLDEED